MSWFEILLLAVSLGMDAFSVGLGVGAKFSQPRQVFRLIWHFGLFQFMMPLLGWQIGSGIGSFAGEYQSWLAAAVLLLVGGKIVRDSFHEGKREIKDTDPTRGWSLVGLSIATSLDAFGVGMGLGLLLESLLYPCLLIGVVAAAMTLLGMKLGERLARFGGKRMEAVGGIVIILIGIKIFFS